MKTWTLHTAWLVRENGMERPMFSRYYVSPGHYGSSNAGRRRPIPGHYGSEGLQATPANAFQPAAAAEVAHSRSILEGVPGASFLSIYRNGHSGLVPDLQKNALSLPLSPSLSPSLPLSLSLPPSLPLSRWAARSDSIQAFVSSAASTARGIHG
jgi:hypothetical protein